MNAAEEMEISRKFLSWIAKERNLSLIRRPLNSNFEELLLLKYFNDDHFEKNAVKDTVFYCIFEKSYKSDVELLRNAIQRFIDGELHVDNFKAISLRRPCSFEEMAIDLALLGCEL